MNPDELGAYVATAPTEALPGILGALESAKATAWARLMAPAAPPEPITDRLLSLPDVASMLGIPEDRAYDLGRQHALAVVKVGKYRRARLSAVLAYIAANERKGLDSAVRAKKARDR